MSVASPCIEVCQINSQQICIGCYRSLQEIACWSQLSEAAKQQVILNAQQRRTEDHSCKKGFDNFS